MDAKLAAAILFILLAVLFFYPKSCTGEKTDCDCLGLKQGACFGIPLSHYCFEEKFDSSKGRIDKMRVPCS